MMKHSLLVCLMMTTGLPTVQAAEYILGADLSPTFSYDDNVLLREDEEGSFLTRLNPMLTFSRELEHTRMTLDGGFRVERFASLSELDREDPFVKFTNVYSTERSVFGLSANYDERAQRNIAEEDTGDFSSDATVTNRSITPTYSYKLTEIDEVYGSVSYTDRSYDTNELSDNETRSITGGWQRRLTERLTGGLALSYLEYESESVFVETVYDTYNLSLTSSYFLSEKWSLSGQVGYRTLESEVTPIGGTSLSDRSSGSLFRFSADYFGELNDLTLSINRSLSPSGEGAVNEQDRITIDWKRFLSETLSFQVNASYQETESADQFNTTDRQYMSFSPSMKWSLERNLALNFGYQFRKTKGSTTENADSNMIFLAIIYDWDGLRFSR